MARSIRASMMRIFCPRKNPKIQESCKNKAIRRTGAKDQLKNARQNKKRLGFNLPPPSLCFFGFSNSLSILTRSSTLDAATQHGAFPLRPAFWARSASSLAGDDPKPFVPTPFQSTVPRSDSWHRIGRNFAHAYIRTYRRVASGRALHSLLLALSSASYSSHTCPLDDTRSR